MMTNREIEEYRRINSADRSTFTRWLTANAVVGSAFVALIALSAISAGGQSNTTTVEKDRPLQRAEVK